MVEENPEKRAEKNTTKADTVIEDSENQKAREKKKAKADETRKRGEAEDRENHSTEHVTTAVRKATWHEIASADNRRRTSRSNKINKTRNMPTKQRYNFRKTLHITHTKHLTYYDRRTR